MIKNFLLGFIILLFANFAEAQTWSTVSQLPNAPAINSISVVNQSTIWVACIAGYVYLTTDGGQTWQLRNTGLSGDLYGISALDDMNCWVGTGTGAIFHTSNGGTSWTQQIAVSGSFIDGIKMFDLNNGVYYADPTGSGQPYQDRYTTDGGTTWTLAPNSPIAGNEFGVINAWDWTDQNHFWMGSANINANPSTANVYYTSTGFTGTFNTAVLNGTGGSNGLYYQAIAFTNNNDGLAASNNGDVMKTTDGGQTWTATNAPPVGVSFAAINMNGLKDGSGLIRMSVNDANAQYHVYTTTDLGANWQEETIPTEGTTYGFQHMQFINANLGYAGGGAGYFFKYQGVTPVELTSFTASALPGKVNLKWTTATETNNRGFEIQRKVVNENSEGQWTTVGFIDGHGTTTEQQNYSYTDNVQNINATKLSYRLRQVDFSGKSEYSSVVNVNNLLPVNFSLSQNFPNPFNPTTKIKYQIPKDNFVSLKVYNTLGQMVADLVDGNVAAGVHEVNFDGSRFTSGVYFYILRIGQNGNDFIKTDKMILMK